MIRKNYTYANDAAALCKLRSVSRAAVIASEKAHIEARELMETFSDDVARISGWAHNFCCPKCASQMVFDPHMAYQPPNVFVCPHCGEKASGVKYDEAWVYIYRITAAAALESVAVCAVEGDEDAYGFMCRFIDFYASRYADFPVHGDHAGKGKI